MSCLRIIEAWMDAHPDAVPISVMTELKTAEGRGGARRIAWDNAALLDGLDAEIRSVFPARRLITPDDVRRAGMSLEESVLEHGWPDLESARGRIFFLMDNGPDGPTRRAYRKGSENLEGRVLFTNAAPGDADCAFQKVRPPPYLTYITYAVCAREPPPTPPAAQRPHHRRRRRPHPAAGPGRVLGPHARRRAAGHGPGRLRDGQARRGAAVRRADRQHRLPRVRDERALGVRLRGAAAGGEGGGVQPGERGWVRGRGAGEEGVSGELMVRVC